MGAWWDGHSEHVRAGVVVGVAFVVVLVLVGWKLLVKYGELLLRLDNLEAAFQASAGAVEPVLMAAPDFHLPGLFGETMTLAALRARNLPVILLFTDPHCGPCGALIPEITSWQQSNRAFTLAVISRGSARGNLDKFATTGIENVLLQRDDEVASAYGIQGTPSAIAVAADGTMASSAARGSDAIRRLVATQGGFQRVPIEMVAQANGHGNGSGNNGNGSHATLATVPVSIGDVAPAVELPDLQGRQINLKVSRETVLVFWNPDCGYCIQLLPQFREWEKQRVDDDVEVVIITTGSLEANNRLGFTSTVLLDESFSVGPQFGANGTPIAVSIDANGLITSDLATGGPAVLALMGAAVSPDHHLSQ